MGDVFVLSCLLLVFSTLAIGETGESATKARKSDDGIGAVVAHLVEQQSSMNAKLQALETSLRATETALAASNRELGVTKKKLTATDSKLQALETSLRATETALAASNRELGVTKKELTATDSKLQALETSLRATKTALAASNRELRVTKKQLAATDTKLRVTQSDLKATMTKLQTTSQGSSFVRWGRKSCPGNTTLVYVGVAGGKYYNDKGSGTNPLCLTRTPQFDNTAKSSLYGRLYGAEYEYIHGHHDHDVPCSVCLAPQSTTIMVPATLTCPPGWTPHYTGHLVSQYKDHYATEYVCLDGSPEDDTSGGRNKDEFVFYYVVTVCGSLPCPPYINDKVVTCVVCSK